MTTVAPSSDKQTSPAGVEPGASAATAATTTPTTATTTTTATASDGPAPPSDGTTGAGTPPGGRRGSGWAPLRLARKLRDALWKGPEERELRAGRHALSERQSADLERAFAVQRLASAAIAAAADAHSRPDAALPAIIGLLRESATWSLSAASTDPPPVTAPEAFARLTPEMLAQLVPEEPAQERLRALFNEPTEAWARRPRDEQERAFREMGAFSTTLLRRLTFTRRRLRGILLRRTVVSLVCGAVIFAAIEIALTAHLRPSLTAGKPWRASSALDICRPKDHYCADAVTDIFFCTTDENNPWVEYDLGDRKTFRQLVVKNRSDCCPDRAVPLALEVSDDQKEWREVIRRNETFSTWRTSLPTTRARYVRLRATRRTILHLDSFDLFR